MPVVAEVRPGRRPVGHQRAPLLVTLALAVTSACAPRTATLSLPAGAGTPIADVAAAQASWRAGCQRPDALTAEVRLSGRIDGERVRGTLQLGVSADSLRLEGLAPFGAPVFVLAVTPAEAILVLPRESAVARATSGGELLDAAVGVPFEPADLRALVAGCGLADGSVSAAESFPGGWTRLDVGAQRRIWLRAVSPGSAPAVLAASDGAWQIEYTRTGPAWPSAIRLRRVASTGGRTDAVLALEAPEALAALPEAALTVTIPEQARVITVADLRASRGLTER